MTFIKVSGLVLICLFAVFILKQLKSEFSYLPIIACLLVAVSLVFSENLQMIINTMNEISKTSTNEYVAVILKSLGISYISVITAEICRSAGEETLARITQIAGKFEILALSLPLALNLIDIASEIL